MNFKSKDVLYAHSKYGSAEWYKNEGLNRTKYPAVIWKDGSMLWYKNHFPHREDGPAIIYSTGENNFYIDGIYIPEHLYPNKFWYHNL